MRLLRVAEIHTVGGRERFLHPRRSGCGNIRQSPACRPRTGRHRHSAGVAVGRNRKPLVGAVNANHRRVAGPISARCRPSPGYRIAPISSGGWRARGLAIIFKRSAPISVLSGISPSGWIFTCALYSSRVMCGRSYSGASSGQRTQRNVAHGLPSVRQRHVPGVGNFARSLQNPAPTCEISLRPLSSRPGFSTMSIRS